MGIYKTPLRYPGGKQKIWRFIAEIIASNDLVGGDYAEPYAGGAGVAMELLLRGHVSRVHLNDCCPAVYSFWHALCHSPEKLCRRISDVPLTVEEWHKQKNILRHPREREHIDVGFAMFYLNRCNWSGILNAGIIGGLAQQGEWRMDARFPRQELIQRIEAIASRSEAIRIRNWDAARFMQEYVPRLPSRSLIYCDPPYYDKADRLYTNHYTADDHKTIAGILQRRVSHPWLVSYDNASAISVHYKNRRRFLYSLQYNAAKAYLGKELFIFSDALSLPAQSVVPAIDVALQDFLHSVLQSASA